MIGRCRHCNRQRTMRGRGLCWRCHTTDAIREQYQSESPYNPHKFGKIKDSYRQSRPPSEPVPYCPGTPEKIAAMTERCERGESLFHDDDFRQPVPMTVDEGDEE